MTPITRCGLDIYVYVRFNQLLIKLRGDFNIATLQIFVSRMRTLKEQYKKQFVFDAKYLKSIDSSGIRTLINFTRLLKNKPAMYHIRDDIMDVFTVTGISYVIKIYKTEKEFKRYS